MPVNALTAMLTLAREKSALVEDRPHSYSISINSVGAGLETFVKDIITGKCYKGDNKERDSAYKRHFSYGGSQNKAIDAIVNNGDAFEIKKIEVKKGKKPAEGMMALNNSYPKEKLYPDDPKILRSVKDIDDGKWKEKDIFYVVGWVEPLEKEIKALYFVQGTCYAAKKEYYNKPFHAVQNAISSFAESAEFSGIEFKENKELGRMHSVDPLKITNFRMRGMWELATPNSVFKDIAPIGNAEEFVAYAIMERCKYEELSKMPVEGHSQGGITLGEALEREKSIKITEGVAKNPNVGGPLLPVMVVKASW